MLDLESSPTTVYERRSVKRVDDDEGDGQYWEYEERSFSRDEYVLYKAANSVSREDNLTDKAALADIYELILELGGGA